MIRSFLCLFLAFAFTSTFAQTTFSGWITEETGSPVPNAIIIANDSVVAVSTEDGTFSFNGNYQKVKIQVRHTGFQPFYRVIQPKGNEVKLKFELDYLQLSEVLIEEKARTDNLQKLSAKDISEIPSASGDFIQQVLGAQAGVAINNELSASYSVRGGSYDENLVYVNGIRVYRPFLVRAGQQEGLSFINSAMVENINFSAGGFAARYGDKMSSVLDITYKKPKKFEGEAELGLMGGNFAAGSASLDGKWTYIGGIRYRANGLLLGSLETRGEYQPQFWDAQFYGTHQLSDKTEIGLLAVHSNNRFRFVPQTRETDFGGFAQALKFTVFFDGQEESRQSATTTALEINHQFSNRSKLNVTLSNFGTVQTENFDIVGQYRLDETNRDFGSDEFGDVVRNLGIGGFLNNARNRIDGNVSSIQARHSYSLGRHFIRTGASYSIENFTEKVKEYQYVDSADYSIPRDPNQLLVFENLRARNKLNTSRIQFFAEDEWKIDLPKDAELAINAGFRGHYYQYNNQFVAGPRASIAFYPKIINQINDSLSVNREMVVRLSYGQYYQPPFYRDLRSLNGVISPDIRAQKSTHYVLSLEYGLIIWDRPFKLLSEFYYKDYDNLIPYELENVRIRYYGENSAKGYATGFDVKLNGEFIEGLESWLSLGVLSTEEDLFNDREEIYLNSDGDTIPSFSFNKTPVDTIVNFPGFIPRPTDQRLRFGMFFRDQMPGFEDLTVQLNFLFGTGLPFGPPDFNRYKDILRTTSYKRVDVGFSKEFIKAGKEYSGLRKNLKSLNFSVEILNLLDAQNVVNHTWIKDVSGGQFAIPNYLTRRRINLKLTALF
ncbi:TonB-dependent receptor [Luteibaculum oceani]|uniref:TonB-dependent receptor n=1 Tax=Luteibaculum oceani TaxID=1294296 RepID=UPI001476BDBA|nr:TonB-dependent receptor [Luteibaculum oceani]